MFPFKIFVYVKSVRGVRSRAPRRNGRKNSSASRNFFCLI